MNETLAVVYKYVPGTSTQKAPSIALDTVREGSLWGCVWVVNKCVDHFVVFIPSLSNLLLFVLTTFALIMMLL